MRRVLLLFLSYFIHHLPVDAAERVACTPPRRSERPAALLLCPGLCPNGENAAGRFCEMFVGHSHHRGTRGGERIRSFPCGSTSSDRDLAWRLLARPRVHCEDARKQQALKQPWRYEIDSIETLSRNCDDEYKELMIKYRRATIKQFRRYLAQPDRRRRAERILWWHVLHQGDIIYIIYY